MGIGAGGGVVTRAWVMKEGEVGKEEEVVSCCPCVVCLLLRITNKLHPSVFIL